VFSSSLQNSAKDAWAGIAELAEVCTPKTLERAHFLAECRSGAFDGCVVAYRTFDSFRITGKVDAEMVAALPSSLRFICHNGAGYDQINVQDCTARGIRVSNTPTAVDDATADIGIWLMIGALRNLAVSMVSLREGKWRGSPLPDLGHDPQGKVLGILGMGGIGRNMAKKALAFGMKIRYYNRTRLDETNEKEIPAEYVDFDTLLQESDVLSLNLPLNVRRPMVPGLLASLRSFRRCFGYRPRLATLSRPRSLPR
jgi:glyoxylate reductase